MCFPACPKFAYVCNVGDLHTYANRENPNAKYESVQRPHFWGSAELGLSQAQLAHQTGLSRQTLVGLEKGALSDLGQPRGADDGSAGPGQPQTGYAGAAQEARPVDGGQDGQCQLCA
ncbi:helix-turn-helix transcriptional regulator [Variovorax saccharolyticus]|uniref:helix-turn-helix transcriptional regulator n=1 Tax=Variovorax saccharolyticus TaxID=3053516 RepID=UPI00336AC093